MKTKTSLGYARYWLFLTAVAFTVGSPFIVFLHFFRGDWFELLAVSTMLSSYFTLIVWYVNHKKALRVENRGKS